MNAERLLQLYDRVSDAPDAIPRLRRFILDLSVRGKLVEQEPADEPALRLLRRINAERDRLIRSKTIKGGSVDPIGLNDIPFALPATWCWTRLGAIGDWGSGSTPSRGNAELYGGGITWLKSGELNDNTELAGSEETVTETTIEKGSFRINQPGDVLIAMYGATIGKLAILAETAVTNQAVCGCTPFAGVFNHFLFLFLLSQREALRRASEGGAQPNISKAKIVNTLFPLAPLAEQHRIVVKFDELMALCDSLEAERKKREATRDRLTTASLSCLTAPGVGEKQFKSHADFAIRVLPELTTRPDQIKVLRQTILNLAVRGKLVAQDPSDEPASDFDRSLAKDTITPFPIPRTWRWSRLHALGDVRGGGTPSKARPELWEGEIPWVSPKDMKRDYIRAAQLRISEAAVRESSVKLIESGSILFVVRGMILAHSFPVAIAQVALTINQDMKALTLKDPCMNAFMLRALMGMKREMLSHVQHSTHGTCRLESDAYLNFLVPVPPLEEQHRIVSKVAELMAICHQLERDLNSGQNVKGRLLVALLVETLEPLAKEAA